ncbi:MAG: cytochrome d ubiquinol oxidase subunit II [Roseobacter sp.]
MFELSFIWAGIIALAVLIYVLLDGFDLGVGILFPLARTEREKATMMNSIAPIWDGNETWLVMGGGGLFAVFPLAYAVVMPALYIPIFLMLLGLIFRGVAFEYRWRTERWKHVWDLAFFGGSLVAAFMQGISLGALVQGIEVSNRAYAGEWWDWLSLFSILTGVAVVVGYALLGATWLVLKTNEDIQHRMRALARWLGIGTLGFIGVVSALTPFQDPAYFSRWFSLPGLLATALMPAAVFAASWALFSGLAKGKDAQPFFAALGLFMLCFIGIGISFYPNMVPPGLSIADAAAPDESLRFALVGTVILLPLILGYTGYAYWVFRGKIDPDKGYH